MNKRINRRKLVNNVSYANIFDLKSCTFFKKEDDIKQHIEVDNFDLQNDYLNRATSNTVQKYQKMNNVLASKTLLPSSKLKTGKFIPDKLVSSTHKQKANLHPTRFRVKLDGTLCDYEEIGESMKYFNIHKNVEVLDEPICVTNVETKVTEVITEPDYNDYYDYWFNGNAKHINLNANYDECEEKFVSLNALLNKKVTTPQSNLNKIEVFEKYENMNSKKNNDVQVSHDELCSKCESQFLKIASEQDVKNKKYEAIIDELKQQLSSLQCQFTKMQSVFEDKLIYHNDKSTNPPKTIAVREECKVERPNTLPIIRVDSQKNLSAIINDVVLPSKGAVPKKTVSFVDDTTKAVKTTANTKVNVSNVLDIVSNTLDCQFNDKIREQVTRRREAKIAQVQNTPKVVPTASFASVTSENLKLPETKITISPVATRKPKINPPSVPKEHKGIQIGIWKKICKVYPEKDNPEHIKARADKALVIYKKLFFSINDKLTSLWESKHKKGVQNPFLAYKSKMWKKLAEFHSTSQTYDAIMSWRANAVAHVDPKDPVQNWAIESTEL